MDDAVDCTCFTALLGSAAKKAFISFSSLLRSTFQLRSKILTFTTCPHDVARRLPPLTFGVFRLLPSLKHWLAILDLTACYINHEFGELSGIAGAFSARCWHCASMRDVTVPALGADRACLNQRSPLPLHLPAKTRPVVN